MMFTVLICTRTIVLDEFIQRVRCPLDEVGLLAQLVFAIDHRYIVKRFKLILVTIDLQAEVSFTKSVILL